MSLLRKDFVDRKISSLTHVPDEWELKPGHYFYKLDLKMCQIRELNYDFHWGDKTLLESGVSVAMEDPAKLVVLDVSLNDLLCLEHSSLVPFTQLRVLDASLNRISRITGLEVLRRLYLLSLSNNMIRHLHGLHNCHSLNELHLGMNEIADISCMPSLNNLAILHLNNNKLRTLDGIQALPHLKELYVQRNNLIDIISLSSSLRLTVLHAADNNIDSLDVTVEVLQGLKRLQGLTLYGNPIERANNYQSRIVEFTSIFSLDNVNVKSKPPQTRHTHGGNMTTIKQATIQAFHEQLKCKRETMEENVNFLQQRIISIQDEFRETEEKMQSDLESCLRNLDNLSDAEGNEYKMDAIQSTSTKVAPAHCCDSPKKSQSKVKPKAYYKEIKDTNEVLRLASVELRKNPSKTDNS